MSSFMDHGMMDDAHALAPGETSAAGPQGELVMLAADDAGAGGAGRGSHGPCARRLRTLGLHHGDLAGWEDRLLAAIGFRI